MISKDFKQHYANFKWHIPEFYNIGMDVCDRWAELSPEKIAIIDVGFDHSFKEYRYKDIQQLSNQLSNALKRRGIASTDQYPDRVAILLPQCVETAVSHIAVFKLGCISIPLFTLFGQDALLHRLKDSGAKALITNSVGLEKIRQIRQELPELSCLITIDAAIDEAENLEDVCRHELPTFTAKKTRSDDPALLIYTSGTTGNPKGALHAHRVLLGHLPGVELSHNFLPIEGDRFWTPADWAWIGGLLDVLLPSLHHGIPVVAHRAIKFNAAQAVQLMQKFGVRNAFLPPTALKLMQSLPDEVFEGLSIRSIGSGGESLSAGLIEWGRRVFGTTINEFYGQTECNMIVSSCAAIEPATPGCMGRAVPGHDVRIIDPLSGLSMDDDLEGSIAVKAPNPVMFIEYWNNSEATRNKFVESPSGQWLLTGDRGVRQADGKIRFIGRDDDVITSSGYRIGPAEIENCLISHESVQLAGAVSKPDDLRGAIVVAYVKLQDGFLPSDELGRELADWVKHRLAAHEYPREIYFITDMPITTTGKLIRATLRNWAVKDANAQ
ncbi:AMP-binding protein [Granulosicoccus sp.]|nr:AMP-binding protein [Granulosicoccus sp.]MDB4222173.1 AMP-binding protein [Granulosicoccus sp.]